jgi:bacillithiol biosynthesis cysteine-adding enzyme BshC
LSGPFSEAFLAGDPRAEPFLAPSFRSSEARRVHVLAAQKRQAHPQLIAALRAQEAVLPPSAARAKNLEALATAGTVAVVTGQQVALFLGPLYSVYKAATAIVCARELERETGVRCVPVFWLQTEDHDFEEIDHCHLVDPEGAVRKLRLASAPAERTSVKHARVGAAPFEALEACVAQAPFAAEVIALFRAHYRPEVSLGQAFAGVMATLFGDQGLLLVDPRDPMLAKAAAPIHAKAISDAGPIAALMIERERALEDAGFAVQVSVRPGAPLSFFHPDGAEGPRHRLTRPASLDSVRDERMGFTFVGRDGEISTAALLDAVDKTPDRFSTSALLRPILQDTLLPTAAIVGGPGELNYFAQVAPLYAAFGLPMPMLVPRSRFRVVDARCRALLEKLRLSAADLEAPHDQVLAKLRPPVPAGQLSPDGLEQRLTAATEAVLAQLTGPQSPDVIDALKRTRGTIGRAASRLAARYRRALDTADTVVSERIDRLQWLLFPNQEPQERVLGLPQFAARIGTRAFIDLVLANTDAWDPRLKELAL